MNGPKHWAEADKLMHTVRELLNILDEEFERQSADPKVPVMTPDMAVTADLVAMYTAVAQAHATLALAAATAQGTAGPATAGHAVRGQWAEVLTGRRTP